jgi:hypothetical protein
MTLRSLVGNVQSKAIESRIVPDLISKVMSSRMQKSGCLEPQELALCQRVFNQISSDASWQRDELDPELLALKILYVFQAGPQETEAQLLAYIRSRYADFTKSVVENSDQESAASSLRGIP